MRFKPAIAIAAVLPLLAAAPEPVRLQRSSPWNLDLAENSCRLIRTFGEGKDKTILQIEGAAPGNMEMIVEGKPLTTSFEKVQARFAPAGRKHFEGTPLVTAESKDPAVLWGDVFMLPEATIDRLEAEQQIGRKNPRVRPPGRSLAEQAALKAQREQFAAKSTALEIRTRRSQPVILETGSMGVPVRLFDQCLRDSLKDWGVDPDLEDKIVRGVWSPDPSLKLTASDYPSSKVFGGVEADVTIRLLVDATGRITRCTSFSNFVDKDFNKLTCDLITKRATFEPAELGDGTKVPSYYVRRVVFRIDR